MDDQGGDPIAEALSAVADQFAGHRDDPPSVAAAPDADFAPYDWDNPGDQPSTDDPDADAADDSTDDDTLETESEDAGIDWDADDNPYKAQAIAHAEKVTRFETALDLVRRLNAAKQMEAAEANAQELYAQLAEVDPEMAETYKGQRQGLIQTTQAAVQEKVGWQHSMAAFHLAMSEVLTPEQMQQVVALGSEIVKAPGLDGMQQAIANKRSAKTSADARVAELEEALRLALLQQGARQRPAAADRVDSAPAARAKVTRPEDADDMDGFMAALAPRLDAHFGRN